MAEISISFVVLWCVIWMLVAHVHWTNAVIRISSCPALRRELGNPFSNELLVLSRNLRCASNEWLEPVLIFGTKTLGGGRSNDLYSLDLTGVDGRAISVQHGGHLHLDRLLLPDHPLSTDQGFQLSFVQVMWNASVSISHSYVYHMTCPDNLPEALSEGSHVRRYSICGTRFVCGEDANGSYSVDEEMLDGCQEINTQSTEEDALGMSESDSHSIKNRTVVIALLCGLLFFVYGGIFLWYYRSHMSRKRDLDACLEKEEDSIKSSVTSTDPNLSLSARLVAIDDFCVDLDHQLGVGGFGTVYAGRFQGQTAAVKVLKMTDVPEGRDIDAEAALSIALTHPNVVMSLATRRIKLKDLYGAQHNNGDDDCTLIFMEYCDKGEMSRAIDRGEYVLNFHSYEPKICAILHSALDIAKGLQCIHAAGIIHGDVKPDNILRKSDDLDPRGYVCKICDFGLSKKVENVISMTKTDALGVVSYMPPEMLRKGRIGKFTDIYSFGMLLWEMITSDVPYSEVDYNQILKEAVNGRRPEIPETTPPTITKLIKACWNSDYTKRPTASNIVKCLNGALSEWYASFPPPSVSTISPRNLKSPERSERALTRSASVHPESIFSDAVIEEIEKENKHSLVRSCSTCPCREPDIAPCTAWDMSTMETELHSESQSTLCIDSMKLLSASELNSFPLDPLEMQMNSV